MTQGLVSGALCGHGIPSGQKTLNTSRSLIRVILLLWLSAGGPPSNRDATNGPSYEISWSGCERESKALVAELFARVLEVASSFDTKGNDAMFERQALLKDAGGEVSDWLASHGPFSVDLSVKSGGRQSQFAPVPWLRIYSSLHSPRTTQGFYLASRQANSSFI